MTRKKHVTIVHKANVLRIGDGMFIDACHAVAKEFPAVQVDDVIVDAMMAHVVRAPERYDVIVTTNMFGDILSDEAAELAGGLGLGASLNAGADHGVAQAAHGSAPSIAGQDKANPTALIISAGMMLMWLSARLNRPEFARAGAAIEKAIDLTLDDPATRTGDLGGILGTKAFTQALIRNLIA